MLHNTVRTAKNALNQQSLLNNSRPNSWNGSNGNRRGSVSDTGSLRKQAAQNLLQEMSAEARATEFSRRRGRAHDIVKQEFRMKKAQIAMMQSGGWRRRIFGMGKQQAGLPGSRLIHPYSPFAQIFTLLSATALVYSALVSSFMVGFLWNAENCDKPPTLEIDLAVDCFFLVEILLNFFVGIIRDGEYCDEFRLVAENYLKRGFVFDVLTSIPVSFLELVIYRACQRGVEQQNSSLDNGFRIVRTLKPLKIARLLRTLKFSRMMSIFSFVSDYMRMPPFVVRALKILLFICLLVHSAACCFWLIKEVSNTQDEIDYFLKANGLKDGLKGSLFHKYIVAFYFVNTVFCTIGFGDIHAANTSERIFCVALFYIGVLVFGSLLAEIQDAVNKVRAASRERENQISTMVEFLREKDVPLGLEKSIVRWTEFSLKNTQRHQAQNLVMDMVPESLFWKLAHHLHHGLLLQIPLFEGTPDYVRHDLTLDLWCKMRPDIYSPYFPIATSRHQQERLYVVMSGTVILQEDGDVIGTLHPGSWFGEYSLLGYQMFGHTTAEECQYVAITNVMCLYISREDFDQVMLNYPDEIKKEMTMRVKAKVAMANDDTESGSVADFRQKLQESEAKSRRSSTANEIADQALDGIMRKKRKSQRARARWREVSRQLLNRNRRTSTAPLESERVQFLQRATKGFIFGGSKEKIDLSSPDNADTSQNRDSARKKKKELMSTSHSSEESFGLSPESVKTKVPNGSKGFTVDSVIASVQSLQDSPGLVSLPLGKKNNLMPVPPLDPQLPPAAVSLMGDQCGGSSDDEVVDDGLRDQWFNMQRVDPEISPGAKGGDSFSKPLTPASSAPILAPDEITRISQRLDDQHEMLVRQDQKLEALNQNIANLTSLVQQLGFINVVAEA